jgi:hypothetical protein
MENAQNSDRGGGIAVLMTPDAGTLRRQGRSIAQALKTVSNQVGHPFSMMTKPGRFQIQKTVYLLKHLDCDRANRYDFNIYLNGPYSPDLAEVYYALGDDGLNSASPTELAPRTLATVAEALGRSPDFLEGLTTVIDGVASRGSPRLAIDWAKSIKPHLNEPTWGEVRAFLVKHPELIGRT